MGFAKFRVSGELFRQWCPLPESVQIVGSIEHVGDEIEIAVMGPGLPVSIVGENLEIVEPRFIKNESGEVVFVDWGVR